MMGLKPKRLKVRKNQEESSHKLRLNVKGKGLCCLHQKASGKARPQTRAAYPLLARAHAGLQKKPQPSPSHLKPGKHSEHLVVLTDS